MGIEVVHHIYYCFVSASTEHSIFALEHAQMKFPPYDYSCCNFYQKRAELVHFNLLRDKSLFVGYLSPEFSSFFDPIQKPYVVERWPGAEASYLTIKEVSHAHPGVTIPSSA